MKKNTSRGFSLSKYFDGRICRCCAIKGVLETHSSLSNVQVLEHFGPTEAKQVRATLDELIKDGEVEFDGNLYRLSGTTTKQTEPTKS